MKYIAYRKQKYLGYYALAGMSIAGAYHIMPTSINSCIPTIGYVWTAIFFPWMAVWSDSRLQYKKNVVRLNGLEYDKSLDNSHLCLYKVFFTIFKKTPELVFDSPDDSAALHWKSTGNKTNKHIKSVSCILYGDWIGDIDTRLVSPEKRQELFGAYTTEIRRKYPQLSSYSIKIEYAQYVGQKNKYEVIRSQP